MACSAAASLESLGGLTQTCEWMVGCLGDELLPALTALVSETGREEGGERRKNGEEEGWGREEELGGRRVGKEAGTGREKVGKEGGMGREGTQ